jgi:hypothetical protein
MMCAEALKLCHFTYPSGPMGVNQTKTVIEYGSSEEAVYRSFVLNKNVLVFAGSKSNYSSG